MRHSVEEHLRLWITYEHKEEKYGYQKETKHAIKHKITQKYKYQATKSNKKYSSNKMEKARNAFVYLKICSISENSQ